MKMVHVLGGPNDGHIYEVPNDLRDIRIPALPTEAHFFDPSQHQPLARTPEIHALPILTEPNRFVVRWPTP